MSAYEKQAAAKQTFVFHAPLTSNPSAKQTVERGTRGIASLRFINLCTGNGGEKFYGTRKKRNKQSGGFLPHSPGSGVDFIVCA
jgi:hypothetical protein